MNTSSELSKFRVSQACDRCRLKKIKCDGQKPRCSNCKKINFNCAISTKLSRRGLPKGYTQALENEVIRLQDLLKQQQQQQQNDNQQPIQSPNTFPFINDTFYIHNNYSYQNCYLGNLSYNHIFDQHSNKFESNNNADNNKNSNTANDWLVDLQLNAMINNLNLNWQFFLPQILISTFKNDITNLKIKIKFAIEKFLQESNSLVPILYPQSHWESKLFQLIDNIEFNKDPLILLSLLYIIQINWNCLNNVKLFKLTKLIIFTNDSNLNSLQVLLLSCHYFMGSPNSYESHSWSTELLNYAYSNILSMGLYINPKQLIKLSERNFIQDDSRNIVTFWSFQFLSSWYSLLNGLPKFNFLINEFQPKEIKNLKLTNLNCFQILIQLMVKNLDGIDFLNFNQNKNTTNKSKIIFLLENFRKKLMNLKLYHNLNDHQLNELIILEKNDFIEIQLTLYYLILTLLVLTSTKVTDTLDEISYEILSLYYLILMNQKNSNLIDQQPLQFNCSHFLPIDNVQIIDICLNNLINWIHSNTNSQDFWKFKKFKKFLKNWCEIWYQNNYQDPKLLKILKSFKIKLTNTKNIQSLNPSIYLEKINNFYNFKKDNNTLLRTDSNAIMDQFNIFAQTPINENLSLNSLRFLSPILANTNGTTTNNNPTQDNETEDDGYIEDNDDDDPLEIPFKKRKVSLFQNKNYQPTNKNFVDLLLLPSSYSHTNDINTGRDNTTSTTTQ
ncbi:hypothetical protein KAFR_0A01480 [Kazachstania africana CBS 2517]|uniref:Zn(2)-C6 fungal-type domain-containing protein n=1 Tax=Kazachstania africana (strain ATCC 22294 / BCRC 22015 / CBS 2517 / CECT 1963 / NBRC 1671 / NRRL Y-8276) TaxID=1071382 RepID=H2AMI6_KAZAF|nr:hypothetical protein KAFR_0A01480 [Kazachstania africana CBS 2517]CCF55586.1 hypothetical protein KAFR_0A01480 [Kazachstania africana CBS 2517]